MWLFLDARCLCGASTSKKSENLKREKKKKDKSWNKLLWGGWGLGEAIGEFSFAGATPPTYCVGPLMATGEEIEDGGERCECLGWLDLQPSTICRVKISVAWFSQENCRHALYQMDGTELNWWIEATTGEDKVLPFFALVNKSAQGNSIYPSCMAKSMVASSASSCFRRSSRASSPTHSPFLTLRVTSCFPS